MSIVYSREYRDHEDEDPLPGDREIDQAKETWYRIHARCPKCKMIVEREKSIKYSLSPGSPGNVYLDGSYTVNCQCGWIGKGKDLLHINCPDRDINYWKKRCLMAEDAIMVIYVHDKPRRGKIWERFWKLITLLISKD